jgi:hypothetical protein
MKPKLFLLLILLPLLAGAAPRLNQLLVGRWRYADKNYSCTYSLRDDGSFDGEVRKESKLMGRFAGRWWISGDTIHYKYTGSSLKGVPVGTIDKDKLVEIEREHFVIVAFDGSRRTYERIGTGR